MLRRPIRRRLPLIEAAKAAKRGGFEGDLLLDDEMAEAAAEAATLVAEAEEAELVAAASAAAAGYDMSTSSSLGCALLSERNETGSLHTELIAIRASLAMQSERFA